MEALRSFLSGRRLAFIGVLLAIPFVFFGSSTFGTVFTNYGKVNGLIVSALDVSVAVNTVTSRLRGIYGDEFSTDTLEEGLLNSLVRNELISQKTLLYQAQKMGTIISEDDAKRLIMQNPSFQVDGMFNQEIFEATIRANGILPNEYIESVQNSTLVNDFLLAISNSDFQIESELKKQIKLIEQERNIDFYKIDFNSLKNNINPTLESATDYYENNELLFMDDERRSFNLILISQDQFREMVEIPQNFIDEEYESYVKQINASAERRISHIMVELNNYNSREDALNYLQSIQEKIANEITFEEAVSQFSEDLVSAELEGDLGFSSGDSFPKEFEMALDDMSVGDLSDIIELEDSIHIIKFTEQNVDKPKEKQQMAKQFTDELIEAESYALMLDLRDEIEDLLLNGFSVESIAKSLEIDFTITDRSSYESFSLFKDTNVKDFLFGLDFSSDFAEMLELDKQVLVASVSEIIEPSVLPFDAVVDKVFDKIREDKANLEIIDLQNSLILDLEDESYILNDNNVTKDSFISVKRGSTLFPPAVLSDIFLARINNIKTSKAFNSDIYIFKVTSINEPSDEFIESVLSDYEDFSSTTSIVKLNLILEKEINKKIKDNIKNLNI